MKAKYRLKKNYQYRYVYKHATSVSDREFVLLFCKSTGLSKVGFSIGKKFGKAVFRNRLRRQMKAVASLLLPSLLDGFHLILIPRKSQAYTFDTIKKSFFELFSKAGIVKK